MKDKIEQISMEVAKADALMFAYEHCFLENHGTETDMELANKGANAFYAIWDIIGKIEQMLGDIAGDIQIVDAIEAAKAAKCSSCPLNQVQ